MMMMMMIVRRNLGVILLLLCVTVIAPLVFYTDHNIASSFTSSSTHHGDGDDVSQQDVLEQLPATAFPHDSRHLNLLSEETTSIEEPTRVLYLDSQDSSFPDKRTSVSLFHSREHASARVLSAANDLNLVKQVTDTHTTTSIEKEAQKDATGGTHANEEQTRAASQSGSKITLLHLVNNEAENKERSDHMFGNAVQSKPRETGSKRPNDKMAPKDLRVRHLKDQLIRAKVYLSLPATRNNPHLTRELRLRMKEVQRALGSAAADSELPKNAYEKLKAMEQTLMKGKQLQDDCASVVKKLRAMIHSTEEQLRVHKKQTMFLTQLTAKTLPKGLHCLPLRLTAEYYSLNYSQQQFPNVENLGDPQLYHYALFSDNILAAAVVVNSTITNTKDPSRHVFHIVTDKLNYAAMRMWFLINPPGKATIQVQNIEEFTWLNSSYSPVLKQLGSPAMIDYYFRAHRTTSDSNLKFRNPKYLSILNHLRFYLPEIFPKLNKVLFLDDDIVVQKDLTGLWSLDLKGNVNGAVETCRESFHRFDRYLNFSNPLIAKNFDPHACGWAYGMNIFDLEEWKRQNITGVYHTWQKLNYDRQLWKLGTLPPGLITFWKSTYPLDKSWHVLGLGYNPNVNQRDIERAAVIHYNGNMKPWLEIGIPKYRNYWAKYVDYDHMYLRDCNINP